MPPTKRFALLLTSLLVATAALDVALPGAPIVSAAKPTPTVQPTPTPTPQPTPAPTPTPKPSPKPTPAPTPVPTPTPAPTPTRKPMPTPSVPPSATPTATSRPTSAQASTPTPASPNSATSPSAAPVGPGAVTSPGDPAPGGEWASGSVGNPILSWAFPILGTPPGTLLVLTITALSGALLLLALRRRRPPDSPIRAGRPREAGDGAFEVPPEERHLPRWRRPSLLAARRRKPWLFERTPLAFSTPAEPGVRRLRVHFRFVQLTDAPDELRARAVGSVELGDEVEILRKEGAYRYVRAPDGSEGWLHRRTLGPRSRAPDAFAFDAAIRAPRRAPSSRRPRRSP